MLSLVLINETDFVEEALRARASQFNDLYQVSISINIYPICYINILGYIYTIILHIQILIYNIHIHIIHDTILYIYMLCYI